MSYSNYSHLDNARRSRLQEPAQMTSDADIWTPTAGQKHMLGAIFETDQGDRYKYAKAAATQIAKAVVITASAPDAQQKASTQTLYGADEGSQKFDAVFTTGSGIVDGALVDGYLLVSDGGDAMGDLYIIKKHKWTTTDTIMSIEIADAGGLRNAIAATDDLTIWKNQYRDVIVKPETLTGTIIGVTLTIIPASYYFWAKVKGVTAVLMDNGDNVLMFDPIGHIDGSTAIGTVGLVASIATDVQLGICMYDSAVDEAGLINLQIPGM